MPLQKNQFCPFLIIFFSFLYMITLFIINLKSSIYQTNNFSWSKNALEQQWLYSDSSSQYNIELPHKFSCPDSLETFTLTTTLNESDYSGILNPSLLLYAKHCNLSVFLNDELLFEYAPLEKDRSKYSGSSYFIVHLPEHWKGQTLRLAFSPLLGDSISYQIPVPLINDQASLLLQMLISRFPILVLIFLLLLTGTILIFYHFLIRKRINFDHNLFHIGLFSVLCAGYIFFQSDIINLLIQNPYFSYYMEHTLLNLMSIPFALLLQKNMDIKYHKLFDVLITLLIANAFLQYLLNFLSIYSFSQTLFITQALYFLGLCILIACLFHTHVTGLRMNRELFLSLISLLIGCIFDIFFYYFSPVDVTVLSVQIGIIIFIAFQLKLVLYRYKEIKSSFYKAKVYRKMAFTDGLTGLGNRAAVERDITEFVKENSSQTIWCFSIDVNNLKVVNDTLGHAAGDQLITSVASILTKAVQKDGNVYRMGGDEFLIFLASHHKYKVDEIKKKIENERISYNQTVEIPVTFAIGAARFNSEIDNSLQETYRRADEIMYAIKNREKGAVSK